MKNGLVTNPNRDQYWYQDDLIHRKDGPAMELFDGSKLWAQHGLYHRDSGPAVEYANNDKYWYIHGMLFGYFVDGIYSLCLEPKSLIGPTDKFQEVSSQEELEKKIKLMLVLQ